MFDIELLRELTAATSPSGCEGEAMSVIKKRLDEYGIKHAETPDGSVVAVRKNGAVGARRLLVTAHVDEAGFMIKSCTDDGKLKITPLGMTEAHLLTGRRVAVKGKDGILRGYVGAVPVHLSKDGGKGMSFDDLYVDIGAESGEMAEKMVPLGSFGAFDTELEVFGGGRCVMGKALSSRVCPFVLLDMLKRLSESGEELPYDLYCAFTVRGQLSLSGCGTVYNRIGADRVIYLGAREQKGDGSDASPETGMVYVPVTEEKYPYHGETVKILRRVSVERGSLLPDSSPVGGTDCYDVLRLRGAGAAVAALFVPVKNVGTSCESARISDVSAASEVLLAALAEMKL